MTAEIESLVLEHLRAIRADIADLKREVTGNSVQLSAMGQQLAGLTAAVYRASPTSTKSNGGWTGLNGGWN
jgi:hypothetical protein